MNYPFDPRGCVVGRNMVNRVRTATSLHSRKHPLSAQNPQLAWGLHGGCEVARAEFKVGGLKTPIRSNTAAGASQRGRSPERPFWAADPGVPVSGEQGPFSYAHRSVSPAGPDPVNPRNPDYFTRSVKLHPRPRHNLRVCSVLPRRGKRSPVGAIHEWPLQDMRPAPFTDRYKMRDRSAAAVSNASASSRSQESRGMPTVSGGIVIGRNLRTGVCPRVGRSTGRESICEFHREKRPPPPPG